MLDRVHATLTHSRARVAARTAMSSNSGGSVSYKNVRSAESRSRKVVVCLRNWQGTNPATYVRQATVATATQRQRLLHTHVFQLLHGRLQAVQILLDTIGGWDLVSVVLDLRNASMSDRLAPSHHT